MAIFEIRPEGLKAAPATSFEMAGVRERADLQRLLKEQIGCLEDGLMVLTEEFSGWVDSARRVDLLCLDADANLVVVELKRDEVGAHMELQALRYAAMVSAMTLDQAVEALAVHRNRAAPDLVSARGDIVDFLGEDITEEKFALDTRIILAAADFSRELTTTVLWLRDRGIDIRCVRLKPYRLEDGRLLVDIQPLIPLPEAEEFQTKLGDKKLAERKERVEQDQLQIRFLHGLLERADGRSVPHTGRTPTSMGVGVLSGSIGRAGFSISYIIRKNDSRVELLIQTEDAKHQFHQIMKNKEAIEAAYGGALVWQEKQATRQCRVFHSVAGGYRSPEAEWPTIQDTLIDAMLRLDSAVRPQVALLA